MQPIHFIFPSRKKATQLLNFFLSKRLKVSEIGDNKFLCNRNEAKRMHAVLGSGSCNSNWE